MDLASSDASCMGSDQLDDALSSPRSADSSMASSGSEGAPAFPQELPDMIYSPDTWEDEESKARPN